MGNHRQGHGRHRLHESILTAVKHGWTKLWRGCGGGGQPGGGGRRRHQRFLLTPNRTGRAPAAWYEEGAVPTGELGAGRGG